MNRLLMIMLLMCMSFIGAAQLPKTKNMLKEIEGKWQLDSDGKVTYIRVLEVPDLSKALICNRVQNYFVYGLNQAPSIVQAKVEDKELGRLLYKGFFNNVHSGFSFGTIVVDCWHTIRVDVKEGRVRLVLTLTEYEMEFVNDDAPSTFTMKGVQDDYPVNSKGEYKNILGKSFYHSHNAANATLDALEEAIKTGNVAKEIESDEW